MKNTQSNCTFLTGIEVLLRKKHLDTKHATGVLCHGATVTDEYQQIVPALLEKGCNIRCIFAPEHGYNGAKQDQKPSSSTYDPVTGLRIYSLYDKTLKPTAEMLQDLDVVIIDLQDIGTRVYTFMYTMALTMQACAEHKKKVIVLDRPNPINAAFLEGALLDTACCSSFVGMYPIPMRHGCTLGELAILFNEAYGIHCELEVIQMEGYNRAKFYDEFPIPWIMPSPNMPTLDTATVYPGSVLFEGTLVSEGRGTTRPFEIIGAPYIHAHQLAQKMNTLGLEGVHFREIYFEPTFNKFAEETCGGVQIHVLNRQIFQPYITGIVLLKTIIEMYPTKFAWKKPPYEHEKKKMPIDLIVGRATFREDITKLSIAELQERYAQVPEEFLRIRDKYKIYS